MAEEALIKVASDSSTNPDLAETCGESLGEIWSRRSSFDPNNFYKLKGMPLLLALGVVETRKPQWKEYTEMVRNKF